MNLLINDFPHAADIDGQIIDINYQYDNCIQIMLAWEDDYLTDEEKVYVTLSLLYDIEIDKISNLQLAFDKALKFLNVGEESETSIDSSVKQPKKRVYSFEQDHQYIFTAIDRVLNGRLSMNENIHWWLFCMAFMEIPDDCMLSKIIYFRGQKNKGKLTKDEKMIYHEMRDIFDFKKDVEKDITEVEVENMNTFMKLLNGGGNDEKD